MKTKLISFVIPIYNEEECINLLWKRLQVLESKIKNYDIEYIFVNDGSKDKSLELLKKLGEKNKKIKIINLSRNFGHQFAITAGADYSMGDAVIVMDADLQDPPEAVLKMIAKYEVGYEVVYAVRKTRKGETMFKKKTAELFYKIINKMSSISIPLDTGDFRLMSRKAVDSLNTLREKHRFVRGMVSWVGFKQTGIYFHRDARAGGETKYPLRKMIKFALDGILSFSDIPLKMATFLGFTTAFIVLAYIIRILFVKYSGLAVSGYSSIMAAILFLGAIQLITIGILGEYVARIYNEAKNRPLYVVDELINIKTKK